MKTDDARSVCYTTKRKRLHLNKKGWVIWKTNRIKSLVAMAIKIREGHET